MHWITDIFYNIFLSSFFITSSILFFSLLLYFILNYLLGPVSYLFETYFQTVEEIDSD